PGRGGARAPCDRWAGARGPTVSLRRTDDVRVDKIRPLVAPELIMEELPADEQVAVFIERSRRAVARIVSGEDDRLLVVVGPCSIHDVAAALDYARRLK